MGMGREVLGLFSKAECSISYTALMQPTDSEVRLTEILAPSNNENNRSTDPAPTQRYVSSAGSSAGSS